MYGPDFPQARDPGSQSTYRSGFIRVLAFCLSDEEFELYLSGARAAREGRAPNEGESAAIQAHNAELERLSLLAGFGSAAEF